MKCKLEDIADINMGQSPKSVYYNNEGIGYPFLQGNRTFGFKYPTFDTYTTVATKLAKTGDIIMSVRAPVGELNITPVVFIENEEWKSRFFILHDEILCFASFKKRRRNGIWICKQKRYK